eukprot:6213740-Pleurochrysis_carterae.AAC.2
MVWERARARGLGAPTEVGLVEGAQRAAAAMCEQGFQSLGSGARALRKYACDATAIWATMHVNVKSRRTATVSGVEPNDRAKNYLSCLEVKTLKNGSRSRYR